MKNPTRPVIRAVTIGDNSGYCYLDIVSDISGDDVTVTGSNRV